MTPPAGLGEGFAYATPTRRVVFADGAAQGIGDEVDRLGVRRALLVTTPGRLAAAPYVRDALGDRLAGVFDRARLHVPASVLQAALDEVHVTRAEVCVALGGGSPIGVAKGIALETGLPIVAVPTTYSGSEMTSVWGITGEEGKRTGRDPRAAPRTVVYDPLLTADFRGKRAAASGMNAVAHCVEALYAVDANPVSALMAEEGIRLLATALPARCGDRDMATARDSAAAATDRHSGAATDPRSDTAATDHHSGAAEPRAAALLGAHLAGAALDATSMGLHHKLCHVLGGMFDLPHALVHAILLPHVTAYNAPAAPGAMAAVRRALEGAAAGPVTGVDGALEGASSPAPGAEAAVGRATGAVSSPAGGLFELGRRLGLEESLRDLGLGPKDLDRTAEAAAARSYPNPAPVTVDGVRAVLEAAWAGEPPG